MIEKVFTQFPLLHTTSLTLKKIEAPHVEDLFAIYDNNKVFEFCGIIPKHNLQTVQKMIGHFERDFKKKSRIKWGIFEAMDFNQKVNMVTIGYYLAEDFWGKGIATKAVEMVVNYLIEEVQVNRIQAEVMPLNEPSKKVLLKNGFINEGLLRQATLWSGKGVVDLEIYGLLKEDYVSHSKN